ncbi:dTDP-glucose 4,6-dehydratase [Thermomonospora catenispora]|uniref:dTDP-glucose 4,6-dehydratase n=1 Tax=Thermomonospora catenispora TaxID=2493090 RepID=UPI001121F1F3|nr:dTDP-glucose 4,6-dehydratase [Thermomonospora catenispora]TNY36125.1 dTDP-glucose 4,6-dehydratase [Thermomonospora catenispora]
MRILVTGGAGFIGSHYVRTMLEGGYPGFEEASVTVLDRLTYAGNRDNLPASHPRLTFVRGSVLDRRLLRSVVDGQDAVVHFAAESHVDRSIATAAAFVRTNVEGTQALLEACLAAGVERVVHVSTDEVYGSIEEGAWTEESPLSPNSPYAASKAASDLVALAYFRTHGVNVSITRCCNNYGPYQHPEKFIPRAVTNLLEGRPVPVYGDGRQVREWLHVDDHCRAVHRVLVHGRAGEVYHIGAGTPVPNLTLAHRLAELCGAGPEMIRHVTDRKGHDRRYALDQTKIETELGHRPLIPFERGLAETVEWYRDNPQWWKPLKEGDELP